MTFVYLEKYDKLLNCIFSVWIVWVCYWRNCHSLFLKKVGNTSQHSNTLYTQNVFGLLSIISKSWPNTKSYFPWGLTTLSYWNFKTIMWFFKEPQLWKWSKLCCCYGHSTTTCYNFDKCSNLCARTPKPQHTKWFKRIYISP